jgi:hypothetical protein
MIVRIATEGQYELAEDVVARLNGLDNDAVAAVESGDEARFARLFGEMITLIHAEGTPLAEDDLRGSDVIVPPPDTSFAEARDEFSGDGLIPD